MRKLERNTGFEQLFHDTGWTMQRLVQEINKIGTERGTPLKYREPSVHQWIKGHMPKESVRPLILEALSRKLQHQVTHTEAGFPPPPEESNAHPGTLDGLIQLGRLAMDLSRRSMLEASLYSAAMTIPAWPDIAGRMEATRTGTPQRIGPSDVQAVEAMTSKLFKIDGEFGGRYTRPMATTFLNNNVVPLLRVDAKTETRHAMLSAASFLCYATGWMAVDEGRHGLAQRYYVKALELAGQGKDKLGYSRTLRGMSVQAVDLGHGATAARLADAAAESAPAAGSRMHAFLAGQQAHSYAATGDRTNALRSIAETESALEKAESPLRSPRGYTASTVAYHTSQVRYALGDVKGSVESMKLHFRLRDSTDSQRSKVRFGGMLAERQLEIGHLDEACHTWHKVLDDYPRIKSARADDRIRELLARIRPHLKNPAARQLHERARAVAPPALLA